MVPVQLDEMEDQFDHADDQDPNLDKLGKCDHDKPPFLKNKRQGAKKRPLQTTRSRKRGERTAAAKSTVSNDTIAYLPANDKPLP